MDGLGGALARTINPYIGVQGKVYKIVNDGTSDIDDFIHGDMDYTTGKVAAYQGSTTGSSYGNEVCSPYQTSWHVDQDCHKMSASSFDQMCKDMKDMHDISHDLEPHSSRVLVEDAFASMTSYVL